MLSRSNIENPECDKEYLESNMSCTTQYILKCFEQRYGDLMDEADKDATNTIKETTEGDKFLFQDTSFQLHTFLTI